MPIITNSFYDPFYYGYPGVPYGPWYPPVSPSYFPISQQIHHGHQIHYHHPYSHAIYTPFNVGHGGGPSIAPINIGQIHVPTHSVPVIPAISAHR